MESSEKITDEKIHKKKEYVFVGKTPFGKSIFKEKKPSKNKPTNSIDFQPTIDELPPIKGEPTFKTKEEADKYSREKLIEKMDAAWEKATSKDGRPPIGGAQDD